MPVIGIRFQTKFFSDDNVILIVNTLRNFIKEKKINPNVNIVYKDLSQITGIDALKIKSFVVLNKDVIRSDSTLTIGTIEDIKAWNINNPRKKDDNELVSLIDDSYEDILFSTEQVHRAREEYAEDSKYKEVENSDDEDDEILIKACKRLRIGEADEAPSATFVPTEAAGAPYVPIDTSATTHAEPVSATLVGNSSETGDISM